MAKAKRKRSQRKPSRKRPPPADPTGSKLGPDPPILRRARACWQSHRYDAALELFEQAVGEHPNSLVALIDAGRAFGSRLEISRAEQLLDEARDIAGERADVLHFLGQSYRMIYRPQQAIDCFERALLRRSDLPDTLLELAILYERRHKLDAAYEKIQACLALQADSFEARFVKARLLRRMRRPSEAESILRQLAGRAAAHYLVRARAWSELALMLDRMGQYEEAFATVMRAKRILRNHEADLIKQSRRESERLKQITDTVTADHFARWKAAKVCDLPGQVALLTGPPRSGTTLLESILSDHPSIVCCDELPALPRYVLPALLGESPGDSIDADGLDLIPAERISAQRQRYCRYFQAASGDSIRNRILVDKNPSMLQLIPLVRRLFPESKLLVAVRDPRDVLLSCFMCYLPLNTVSVQFLTLERAASQYCAEMDAWLKLREMVPDAQVELPYEELVDDDRRVIGRALECLGLGGDDVMSGKGARAAEVTANSPSYEDVAKPIYRSSVGRWKNYEKFLAPVLPRLHRYVDALGYRAT